MEKIMNIGKLCHTKGNDYKSIKWEKIKLHAGRFKVLQGWVSIRSIFLYAYKVQSLVAFIREKNLGFIRSNALFSPFFPQSCLYNVKWLDFPIFCKGPLYLKDPVWKKMSIFIWEKNKLQSLYYYPQKFLYLLATPYNIIYNWVSVAYYNLYRGHYKAGQLSTY